MAEMRRVVVTGVGAVTPVGNTAEEFWAALIQGKSGIGPVTRFDASSLPTRIAGELKGFDPLRYIDKKDDRKLDPFLKYAIACAAMAVEDAGLNVERVDRTRFGVLGLVLFLWTSTRLIATLRTSLREIFDLPEERGIVEGKVFDVQMVLVAGTLFVANTGITLVLDAAQNWGVRLVGSRWIDVETVQLVWARLLAFFFIFLMFLLIYRYLPRRRTPWRMALVAAVFTAVAWEALKSLFAVYVSYATSWATVYGALVTPIILVLWIYYSAVVFILGGEIAHVDELMRVRRAQRELLE